MPETRFETQSIELGLDLSEIKAEIIEIGALKIKDSIQSELSILLKPRKQVPISIYHLCSGLKEEDLENGHTLEEAKKMLLEFVEDLPIICHNASFEISFFDTYRADYSVIRAKRIYTLTINIVNELENNIKRRKY